MSKIKISTLPTVTTATLHLKDARGVPMMYAPEAGAEGEEAQLQPVTVTVCGPGSEQHRKAQLAARHRIMALLKQAEEAGKPRTLTDDERDADSAELLADMVIDVQGLDFEGQSMRDGLRALFADQTCGYITEQVNGFAGDWANFYKGAAGA